ncbi:MAG TPA: IS982 family transposase [Pyrinomonadaceae bacterium]|nr:IS982 family transposase [Pyrinomonadaceae bacterium]
MDILPLFCDIDDFCQFFEPRWKKRLLSSGARQRDCAARLCLSEVMTIIVLFHASSYRNFKAYYTEHVMKQYAGAFPRLTSYSRFVELMPAALVPLCGYLQTRKGECSGISFVDSTSLKVCHNRRIHSHKVFAGCARRGKTSVDWFFGFKLHLVTNDCGELLALRLTPGNTDDRQPVPALIKELFGKLFGDKGYISQPLFEALYDEGVQLVTKLKSRMKSRLLPMFDKIMLRKRAIIESVVDQLKNISQIEHSRHRSVANCLVNLLGGLIAYTFREKKPSLNIRVKEQLQLPALIF